MLQQNLRGVGRRRTIWAWVVASCTLLACGLSEDGRGELRDEPFEPTEQSENPATPEDEPVAPGDGQVDAAPGPDGGPTKGEGAADGCQEAAALAHEILSERCAVCHDDGARSGGFGNVLDTAGLIADGRIVPGDPQGSRVYRLVQSGAMPEGGPRLSPEQVDTIAAWITCEGENDGGADDAPGEPGPADPPPDDDDDAPPSGVCSDDACGRAGGECSGDVCKVDCRDDGCRDTVVCPTGTTCEVRCDDRSCEGGVDCTQASACEIRCDDDRACERAVSCGDVPCEID